MNLGSQKKLALIVCSKKPYRTLEDYALTLAGIPPLTATAFKIRSENDELNRLYHSYLKTLKDAAVLKDLRVAKSGLNWVCRYEDFQVWAQKTGYMEAPAVENVARPKKLFEKRLDALGQWMDKNGFEEGCILPKYYTIKKVYGELCTFNIDLFGSLELCSFERHFWDKQKLCKLESGRKDAVI